MDQTAKECIEVIARQKGLPAGGISLESTFEGLQLDSLDRVNVCFELEERFRITIPDSKLEELRSVGDIVNGIKEAVARRDAWQPLPAASR